MGEARRKKKAGYVPEPRTKRNHPRQIKAVGYGGMSSMALVAKLLADYPNLPNGK